LALYVKNLVNIYGNHSGFTLANVTAGQYQMEEAGVWRTHSTFNPKTGRRRSSDTLLDRNNTNLKIRTNTKVTAILFDGDGGIPYRVRSRRTGLSRARCVRLASLELICVKPEGRIYLSAGAFHTPALLMRSGIGPNGTRFKNSEVGQNLVDKPALLVAGSFQPGFDESARLDFSHIAATQQGSGGTQLYEELNVGVDAMLSLAAWQRNFVPASIRNTLFADAATELIDFCDNEVDVNPTPSFLCDQVVPIVKGGCHKNIFGVASLIGEPTSRGTISLNSMGQVNVDVNYLTTDHDLRAFGAAVRTGFGIVTAHTGATAPQLPCKDKTDAKCMSTSCPELIADYIDYTRGVLKLLLPKEAYKMKAAPASVIYPQFIEPALANISYDDDLVFGKFIRDDIFAAHHFAGSASIGTVVDSSLSFQVMALGRIAGLRAVAELSES
jgi:choline dehydrogenase-like flavoprotein